MSLVPPRPPSKRNPERSLFPDTKKDADLYPGYCEICRVDYQDLKLHCKADSHQKYSMNAENYADLDSRINAHALTADALLNILTPVNTR